MSLTGKRLTKVIIKGIGFQFESEEELYYQDASNAIKFLESKAEEVKNQKTYYDYDASNYVLKYGHSKFVYEEIRLEFLDYED